MQEFFHKLSQLNEAWAYLFLFISAFVENIFPPIPGDTVTVIGAYFVGTGKLRFSLVYLSTTLGSVAGFMFLYGLAYWLEWKVVEKWYPRWFQKPHIHKVNNWLQRYGYGVVLANRFLSGARSVISVVAGLSRLRPLWVFLSATLSALLWNGVLIFLGASLGKRWESVLHFLKLYNRVVIGVFIGIVVMYIAYWWWQRQRAKMMVNRENGNGQSF